MWLTLALLVWGIAQTTRAQIPKSDDQEFTQVRQYVASVDETTPSSPMILSGAMSLHFEIPELGLTYRRVLEHALHLGLTHVALVTQATMSHIRSSHVRLDRPHATPLSTIRQTAELARELGLQVIIFPVLWIESREDGEWRGVLDPKDINLWCSSYEDWLGELAIIAQSCGATHLSIGSELSSLERYEGRWRALIRRLRTSFSGHLIYSANWDHYDYVHFWDALDLVGITGYYPIAKEGQPVSKSSMITRWRWIRLMISEWLDTLKTSRPLMITELGYPSQKGGAIRPWHYTQSTDVDLEVQRQAFSAFHQAWLGSTRLAGVNVWNLWGLGGTQDTWYTLRGKIAMDEVRTFVKIFKSRAHTHPHFE